MIDTSKKASRSLSSFQSDLMEKKNHLGSQKSPYLLQHQYNPVHWFPYCKEAFEIAKKEDKPLMISIGYATCHWCHVMERESFEDKSVADVLNEHFVSIKVDREEMPDVDAIYMKATTAMLRSGGWPLTVFVTPQGIPFFCGTYFPKLQFLRILMKITVGWQNKIERESLLETGQALYSYLKSSNDLYEDKISHLTGETVGNMLSKFYKNSISTYDAQFGGFGPPPKFPPTGRLRMLLRLYRRTKDEKSLQMVEGTLKGMAYGGLFDHIGGGFMRYSTDREWKIPHFEKMLYDNAFLIQTYLETFKITNNYLFGEVAKETLNYILEIMENKDEGGYYSAEDAESEHEEGKVYLWNFNELKSVLDSNEFDEFTKMFDIDEDGNYENCENHLNLNKDFDWIAKKENENIKNAFKKLKTIRQNRVLPLKDDKQLTSWNGMMIKSMAMGYKILKDEKYLQSAENAANFIYNKLYDVDQGIWRRYKDGEKKYFGTLDDYAFLIDGLLELYECKWDEKWLKWAVDLQNKQDNGFWDDDKGGYWFTNDKISEEFDVLVRQKEYTDNALPSGNSVSSLNLLKLSNLMYNDAWLDKAKTIFGCCGDLLKSHPEAFSYMLLAVDYLFDKNKQIAVVVQKGEEEKVQKWIRDCDWNPNMVVAVKFDSADTDVALLKGKKADGKVTFYVCEGEVCLPPETDLDKAKKVVEDVDKYQLGASL